MKLTLNTILYKLQDLNPQVSFSSKKELFFEGVKLFYSSSNNKSTNFIYIISKEDFFENLDNLDDRITYFCTSDSVISLTENLLKQFQIVFFLESMPLAFLFNRILDIFSDFSTWDKSIHLATLDGSEIQDIVDLSSNIIERPMIIFDTSFNVLAYTRNKIQEYPVYQQTVRQGYTSAHIIQELRRDKLFQQLHHINEPIVLHAAGSKNEKNIYWKIGHEKQIFAYSSIYFGTDFPHEGYIALMKMFFENLTLFFERHNKMHKADDFMYQTFITSLLNAPDILEIRLDEQLKYIDDLESSGYFILFRIEFLEDDDVPLDFICREIKSNLIFAKPFIYNQGICILMSYPMQEKLDEYTHKTPSDIEKLLRGSSCICGISNTFFQLKNINTAYIQSSAAIETGLKLGLDSDSRIFFYYQDYIQYHILELSSMTLPLIQLQYPPYLKMKNHDTKNNTGFCKFMYTYLINERNATVVSEKLFMHRNTIINRVNRICKMFNLDLNQYSVRLNLLISYEIDQLIQ